MFVAQGDEEPLMGAELQLETDLAMSQRPKQDQWPKQKEWPADECATALKIPKASLTHSHTLHKSGA